MRNVPSMIGAALGVAAIAYADSDDAPGLGMLGFVLIAASVAWAVRGVRGGGMRS